MGLVPELMNLLFTAKEESSCHKVVIFFTTARLTGLYAELFQSLGFDGVLEIHSRKSQSHRKRVAEQFRDGNKLFLFTSDVSARGMDYPNVTHVIQVGLPTDAAQYVHRLGRTARGDSLTGAGILLLCDFESRGLGMLKEQPIQSVPALSDDEIQSALPAVAKAFKALPDMTVTSAYQAWVGFYNSNLRMCKLSKEELVEYANEWVVDVCGRQEPPALMRNTVMKMGLMNVAGLRIDDRGGGKGGGGKGKGGGGKGKGKSGGKGKGGGEQKRKRV